MIIKKLLPVLLLLLLPALAGAQTPAEIEQFKKEWAAAQKVKDKKAMERLMRRSQDAAVYLILDTAEAIQGNPKESIFETLSALRTSWKEVHKTNFVGEMERFFSFLDSPTTRKRGAILQNYYDVHPRMLQAFTDKDIDKIAVMSVQMEEFAKRFEEINDKFMASQCWYMVGYSWTDGHRSPATVDKARAGAGYQRCLNLRKEIGLEDRLALGIEDYLRRIKDEGIEPAEPGTGGASGGEPAAPVSPIKTTGTAVRAPLEFELVDEVDDFARPNYNQDAFHSMWYPTYLDENTGNRMALGRAKQGTPQLMRVGSAEVKVDTNADGEPDVDVPLTGNVTPIQFDLEPGTGEERPWAVLVVPGLEQDFYQGIEVNTSATDSLMPLYLFPAASMVAELDGTRVQILDEDLDGVYGSLWTSYAQIGLTKDVFQPEFDSVRIGKDKSARPWSEYQKVGDSWYKLAVTGAAKTLEATPVEFKTGTVSLKYKGGKPEYMIIKGENEYANCFFDIVKGKVEVPVGTYTLFVGELRKGRKLQANKSLILPSKEAVTWTVTEGENTEIELGSPFGFDFEFTTSGRQLTVDGHTVCVVGVGGERYERAWNCVPQPEVFYRSVGSKRGTSADEMGMVQSLTDGKYQYVDAWHPLTHTVEMRGASGEIEVQLVEKKNALFGKIESEWKGK